MTALDNAGLVATPIVGRIVVEEVCPDGGPSAGSLWIWVRHDGFPQFDAKLATIHYSRAYQDNSCRREHAAEIARVYRKLLGVGVALAAGQP